MLAEIQSDVFRVPKIIFHPGLNVVIGDADAANSIGKSTFLMLVDFVFGGESFIEHNSDVPKHLGDHEYAFSFTFDRSKYFFKRGTVDPKIVYECDEKYNIVRAISISDYTSWLSQQYAPNLPLSFRTMIGPYSRIWPKDNIKNVNKPLHAAAAQPSSDAITNFVRLFDRFNEIEEVSERFKVVNDRRKAWKRAEGLSLMDKIGRREYAANEKALNKISEEVADIRSDLAKYALNIREVVNRELLDLAQDKDMLLRERSKLDERLRRIENNLSTNSHVKSQQFDALTEFFPEVNVKKIAEIEEFHNSVARLLKKELLQSRVTLQSQLQEIIVAIAQIDTKISERLMNFENPTVLVDRVYGLSENWTQLKRANDQFEKKSALDAEFNSAKDALGDIKREILADLAEKVNQEISQIVEFIYGSGANSPRLELNENSYSYDIGDDTGTGTAYANLVLFDIAILSLTELPILIHDLPLFKNVENEAVAGFIIKYSDFTKKQIFTSIDEIDKYGETIGDVLRKRCVLELNEQEVLYKKKWRSR